MQIFRRSQIVADRKCYGFFGLADKNVRAPSGYYEMGPTSRLVGCSKADHDPGFCGVGCAEVDFHLVGCVAKFQ